MPTYLSACWRKPSKQIRGRKERREGKEKRKEIRKRRKKEKKEREERLEVIPPLFFPSSVCDYGIITVALYHAQIQL